MSVLKTSKMYTSIRKIIYRFGALVPMSTSLSQLFQALAYSICGFQKSVSIAPQKKTFTTTHHPGKLRAFNCAFVAKE